MRQNGTRILCLAFASGMVAAGILVTGCAAAQSHSPARLRTLPHERALPRADAKITINSQIGEVFVSAPASARPALTAQQAWAKFARLNRFRKLGIPSGVTVKLGLFTLPVGPSGSNSSQSYVAKNELAYGFGSRSCPIYANPSVTKPPPTPCILWNFLNADTGQQIVMGWQQ
jgi:hypothetical protein